MARNLTMASIHHYRALHRASAERAEGARLGVHRLREEGHPCPAARRLSEQDGLPEVGGGEPRYSDVTDGDQHAAAMEACVLHQDLHPKLNRIYPQVLVMD